MVMELVIISVRRFMACLHDILRRMREVGRKGMRVRVRVHMTMGKEIARALAWAVVSVAEKARERGHRALHQR